MQPGEDRSNTGNTMVIGTQPRNKLGDQRGQDDEVPTFVWQGRKKENQKGKRVVTLEEERIIRWTMDDKEDQGKEEEIEENHRKIEELVPRKFLKWRKVFEKVKSKRMLTRKVWDHAIDLKETFKLQKKRIYPLFKNEREKVQNFMRD